MTADVEAYLAARVEGYVGLLKQWCAIPSVSTQPARKADAFRAAQFVADRLERAGMGEVALPSHPRSSTGHRRLARRRAGAHGTGLWPL
jgi:hypothetical protein